MGSSVSTLKNDLAGRTILKSQIPHQLLPIIDSNVAKIPDSFTFEQLVEALQHKTDAFLTHNWGAGQANHNRVAIVNQKLQSRGFKTWFDSEKMEGNVKEKMIEGIDNASCIVVFVTQQYIDKVGGKNASDNCKLEFNYAERQKTGDKMVPVVMEAEVRNANMWRGEVGMVLGGTLYVDMCDAISEEKMDELCSRIMSVIGGVKLQSLIEECVKAVMGGSDGSGAGGSVLTKVTSAAALSTAAGSNRSLDSLSGVELLGLFQSLKLEVSESVMAEHGLNGELLSFVESANDLSDLGINLSGVKAKLLLSKIKQWNEEGVAVSGLLPAAVNVTQQASSAPIHTPIATTVPTVPTAVSTVTSNVNAPESSVAAMISSAGTVVDKVKWEPSTFYYNENIRQYRCISCSCDGKLLALGGSEGSVRIFDYETNECLTQLYGFEMMEMVESVCFSPDSTLLAAGSNEDTIKVWNVSSGECIYSRKRSVNWNIGLSNVCFTSSGSTIVVGDKTGLSKFEVPSGQQLVELKNKAEFLCIAFSSDDTVFVTGDYEDKAVKLWKSSNFELMKTFTGHTGSVHSVCFCCENNKIISGSSDKTVRIWERSSGNCLLTIEVGYHRHFCASKDGTLIVVAESVRCVKVWNGTTGRLIDVLVDFGFDLRKVCFAESDSAIVTLDCKTITVWKKDR